MKKVYFPATMTVVEFQQRSHILAGSVTNIDGNTDLGYGGGGTEDAMSPELEDLLGLPF
jgi:hypothetical protein